MKMNKWAAAGLVLGLYGMFLGGCGKKQDDQTDIIYVGVTYYNQSDTFLNELLDCFGDELKALEGERFETAVTVRDAGGSQRTQNDQVKELIDAGCNVLCVNLVDRADPSEIIDLAKGYDVPIIFFNREPVREDLMQWDRLYYVGADARQSGIMQGELAAGLILENSRIDRNNDGKIQYVVLEGEAGHQDTILRTENAVNTLRNNGIELEKLNCQIANWNRAQAQNRMVQMIGQYQNRIELVLANNDDMALGAIDAYEQLNFTESAFPVFLGIDGTRVGLEALMDGRLSGTVYNDKEGQARMMAQLAVAVTRKEGMDKFQFKNGKCLYLPYLEINPSATTLISFQPARTESRK